VDALRRKLRVAADVIVEVRVAAIDDRVARLQVLQQFASVASPAGTITQTARGFSRAATSSAIEYDGVAPSPAISVVFSGVRL